MGQNILIIDYGMGNLHSIKKKLDRLNVHAQVSSDELTILKADKLILPGVGHFSKAMKNISELGILDAINYAVMDKQKPILGICLGMQLMTNKSEEGNANGFGWFDADVVKFERDPNLKFKIPHIGWNQLTLKKESSLFSDIHTDSEFYFVHSYHVKLHDANDALSETEYGISFTSAIQKNNIFGVQFHPEKSHDAGEQLIKNFVDIHV